MTCTSRVTTVKPAQRRNNVMLYACVMLFVSSYAFLEWNPSDIRDSNCHFSVYNSMNFVETTTRYIVYFTCSTRFYHDDHFRHDDVI